MRSINWANSSFDEPVTTATMPLLWICLRYFALVLS